MITEKIKKIFFIIKNSLNDKMKQYDLTAAQIILLEFLYENSEKIIIQKDICEFLSLKHSTVINILKRLEEKELIIKKTNYKSNVSITDKGKELIKISGIKKGFVENQLLKGFSNKEVEELSNCLDRIYSNLNNS